MRKTDLHSLYFMKQTYMGYNSALFFHGMHTITYYNTDTEAWQSNHKGQACTENELFPGSLCN